MWDRVKTVLRDSKRVEKERKRIRKEEMARLKYKAAYKARLQDDLRYVNMLLDCNNVDRVEITVPDKMLTQFTSAIYDEDLIEYDVRQQSQANKFYLSKKTITL